MKYYKENQRGGIIGVSLVVLIAVLISAFVFKGDIEGFSDPGFYAFVVLLFLVLAVFSSLKTEVDDENIRLKFGIGLVKKSIPLSRISSVQVVRNKWIYGWGIRYYGKGWMWNYTGLDAVELQFNDKKSSFRIGSGRAEELKAALDRLLKVN